MLRVDPRCGRTRAPGNVRVAPVTFLVPAFAIHEAPGWLPSEIARRLDVVVAPHERSSRSGGHIWNEHTSDPARSREAPILARVGYPAHPRVPRPNPTSAG